MLMQKLQSKITVSAFSLATLATMPWLNSKFARYTEAFREYYVLHCILARDVDIIHDNNNTNMYNGTCSIYSAFHTLPNRRWLGLIRTEIK